MSNNLGKAIKKYAVIASIVIVVIFILALFISPLLHPDRKVTKIGVITHVSSAGDPWFNKVSYTLTFQDGDVLTVEAGGSVPVPVGKPVAIVYSAREHTLLAPPRLVNSP